MSNPFDQFDTVATVTPAPAANPFDQFDSPAIPRPQANVFDQFDTPAATPYSGSATLDAEYPFDQFNLAPPPSAANFFDQFDTPSAPSHGNVFDQFDTPNEMPQTGGGKPLVQNIGRTVATRAQGPYPQANERGTRFETARETDRRIEIAREILRLHKETGGHKDIYGVLPESKRLAEVQSELSSLFPPGDTWQIPPRDKTNFDQARYDALNDERWKLELSINKQLTPPDNRSFPQAMWDVAKSIRFDPGKMFKPEIEEMAEASERRANRPKNLERLKALRTLLPVEDFEKLREAAEATDWKNNSANYARLPDGRIRFRPEVFNSRAGYERTIKKIVADGEWTPDQGAIALAKYEDIEREQDEMKFQQAQKTRSFQDYSKEFLSQPKNLGKAEADAWKAYRDTLFYKRLPDIAGYLSGVATKGAMDNLVYPGALLGIEAMQSAAAAKDTSQAHVLADQATKLLLDTIGKPGYWDDVRGSGSGALDAAAQGIGQLVGQAALYKLGGRRAVMATAPMQTAMEAYTSAYQTNAKYGPDGKITNGEEAHKIATEAARSGAAGGLLDLLPLESVMARVPNGGVKGVGKALVSGLLEMGAEHAQDRWTHAVNQAVSPEYVKDEGIDWEQYSGMGVGVALTDFLKQGIERKMAGRNATRRRDTPPPAEPGNQKHTDSVPPPPEASHTAPAPSPASPEPPLKDDREENRQPGNTVGTPKPRPEDQTSAPATTAPTDETADAEYQPSETGNRESGAPAQTNRKNQVALSLLNEERARLLEQLTNTTPNTATAGIITERLHELNTLATQFDTQGNQEPQLPHPPAQQQETSESNPDPLPASDASRSSTRTRPDTNTSTADRPPGGTPAHPSRTNGAALTILQQEKDSLLQKLDATDSQSAEGSILRERLGEINAQIEKFNNLTGNSPAPTNRKNGAALAILQQERNSLLQRLDATDSRSAEGSILNERLGEINALLNKFAALEHHHGEGRLPHPQTAHATEETGLPKNPGYDTQDSHEQGSQERKAVRNGMPARKTSRSEGDSSGNESTKEEARAAAPAFHALGVHIVSGRKVTRVVPQPNGGIVLEVNETELHAQDRKADRHGLTPGSYTRAVLGEELSHAGHAAVLKEDWLNDNEGLLFDAYVAKKNHELFQDIRRTIEHASPRERVALLQAVQDVSLLSKTGKI